MKFGNLSIKIFADGADLDDLKHLRKNSLIQGFTTNPTLMKNAGVTDYEEFAKRAVDIVEGKKISFEVFSDELDEMISQARIISRWGANISVKVPIVNTRGQSSCDIVRQLSQEGIAINVTAIFSQRQYTEVIDCFDKDAESIVSIFAGRIADTGVDPVPIIADAVKYAKYKKGVEILWASPREALNIIQADQVNCDIITVPPAMIDKFVNSYGKDLEEFSVETVKMFHDDAIQSNFYIN